MTTFAVSRELTAIALENFGGSLTSPVPSRPGKLTRQVDFGAAVARNSVQV
jgi:hypothetical protein